MADTTTPDAIFEEIDARLKDPARALSFNGVFSFDLSGQPYHIVVKEGRGEAAAGLVDDPNVRVTMSGDDFVKMANGQLDGMTAYMTQKLKIQGDMGLAMKLQSLLR